MSILFIDRALKPGEKTHYKCTTCGSYLNPDFAYSHKCVTLVPAHFNNSKREVTVFMQLKKKQEDKND